MTVTVEYEAEEKLDLPYEEIIKNVIEESLDYVECPYDAEVNVLLTDNAGIHQINLDMRGIDNPTDVLSFAISIGFFLYVFAAAIAPLHWYSQRSGRLSLHRCGVRRISGI